MAKRVNDDGDEIDDSELSYVPWEPAIRAPKLLDLNSIDLKELSRIDQENLRDERLFLPANYATLVSAYSDAAKDYAKAKLAFEKWMAITDSNVRAALVTKKGATEPAIANIIRQQNGYGELAAQMAYAEIDMTFLGKAIRCLEVKKDMLMSVAADDRNELMG